MRAAVRKMGNSSGVIIPKGVLGQAGLKAGDAVEIEVRDGVVVIEPVRAVREGWARAAAEIAAAGDDRLQWPQFANEGDGELKW